MRRLFFSHAAQKDFQDITEYSVQQWGEEKAQEYVSKIRDVCTLATTNQLYRRDATDIRSGCFRASAGSHVIFYELHDEYVEIIRILHENRDLPNIV